MKRAAMLVLAVMFSSCGGGGSTDGGGAIAITADNNADEIGDGVVQFTASADDLSGATLTWDFGDGDTATGAQVSHAYTKAGNYSVRVTALGTGGQKRGEASTAAVVRFRDFVAGRDCIAGSGWCWQTSNIVADVYEPFFIDAANGWIPGANGLLARTADGGHTWQRVPMNRLQSVMSARFLDTTHGMLSLSNGRLLRTANGGVSWEELVPSVSNPLYVAARLVAWDGQRIVLDNGIVSHDAGATWELLNMRVSWVLDADCFTEADWNKRLYRAAGCTGPAIDVSPPLVLNVHSTSFANSRHGITLALGWSGADSVGEETLDGGSTWSDFVPAGIEKADVRHLQMVDDANVWAWTDRPGEGLYRSTDAGRHWATIMLPARLTDGASAHRGFFKAESSDRAWLSNGDTVGLTRDGGVTWAIVDVGSEFEYYDRLDVFQWSDDDKTIVLNFGGRVYTTSDGGASWQRVFGADARDQNVQETGIWFRDAQHGMVVMNDGAVRRTSDGGRTWIRSSQLPVWQGIVHSMKLQAAGDTAWLIHGGALYKSTDIGLHWTLVQSSGGLHYVEDMAWTDANHGWKIDGGVYKTVNGGTDWTQIQGPWVHGAAAVGFVSSTHGVVLEGPAWDSDTWRLWRTEDGGQAWTEIPSFPLGLGRFQAEGGRLWSLNGPSFSEDGGKTWIAVPVKIIGMVRNVSFSDTQHGTLVTNTHVYSTADGGQHWVDLPLGTRRFMTSVFQLDQYTAWIGASSGEVIATATAGK